MIVGTPVTAAEISDEWIAIRREIIVRDGLAVRAGEGRSIEIKSLVTNEWHPLQLNATGSLELASVGDRDAVMRQLVGEESK